MPAAAVDAFAPHRAVYEMSLVKVGQGIDLANAGGIMEITFEDTCDGWSTEIDDALRLSYVDQPAAILSEWSYRSWEAKDGSEFYFVQTRRENGSQVDAVEGRARRPHPGAAPTLTLTKPEALETALPADVLFPNAHTLALFSAFDGGKTVVTAPVFDGTDAETVYDVTAFNLKREGADAEPELRHPLLATPSYRMSLAFFAQGTPEEATPDFEMTMRFHLNGVSERVRHVYPDFTLKAKLIELETLPRPVCD